MLHLRCGDDIMEKLVVAGLPGLRRRWADPLCEGPVPAGLDLASFRAVRAAFLAERCGLDPAAVSADLARQDAALDEAADHDEIVLWFEHDLFDQTILIHLLTRLAQTAPGVPLSLICIGSHPDIPRFIGLGQLDAAQLRTLFPARRPVTADMIDLAKAAWTCFTAPDPTGLTAFLHTDTAALPFLAAALRRHLEQLPWWGDGLSRTERLVLEAVAAGAATPSEIFRFVQRQEPAPWQGDIFLFASLRDLSSGPNAPFIATGTEWPRAVSLNLTETGRALLNGEADWLSLRPVNRWVSGVHLGPEPCWRWNPHEGTVERAG